VRISEPDIFLPLSRLDLEIVLGEVIGDNAMVGNIRHERPVHAVCFLRL